MKYFTKEVQIALVAIVGVVVLFFGLNFLKGLSLVSDDDTYYVTFTDINGLTATSPVYAGGYKIGVVTDIDYDFGKTGKTIAVIAIDKRMNLPVGTQAEIESDMLGNIKMNILLPEERDALMSAGDTIDGVTDSGILTQAANMLPAVERLLPKLDSIMSSINTLLADGAVTGTLHNVEDITAGLTVTTRQLNTLMGNLNDNVPALMTSATNVLGQAETLTGTLNGIDFASTMTKVDATLANVETMTDRLNSKDGTIGLLMNDPTLYLNLASTMRSADSLLVDLKAHPKRYVHFSLFGKKSD